MSVHVHKHACIYTCIHSVYVCIHWYMSVCVYMCVYMCVYIYDRRQKWEVSFGLIGYVFIYEPNPNLLWCQKSSFVQTQDINTDCAINNSLFKIWGAIRRMYFKSLMSVAKLREFFRSKLLTIYCWNVWRCHSRLPGTP